MQLFWFFHTKINENRYIIIVMLNYKRTVRELHGIFKS